MKKIRTLFILPSLHPGGAERVMSTIAQNLNKKQFKTHLLVLYNSGDRDYTVKGITIIYLKKKRTLYTIPAIIKHIRAFEPNIVLTSIGQLNILGGFLNPFYRNVHFIARESSVYSVRKNFSHKGGFYNDILTRVFYKKLSGLICESTDTAEDLHRNLGIKKDRLIRIGNPVHFEPGFNLSNTRHGNVPQLISIGRLVKVKGFERIIDALCELEFNFHYILIGDGEDRELLLKIIKDVGLEKQFTHIPYTDKVQSYLAQSDLFLQGSYVEGFGMALLESFAVGIPAVVFDAPGGPRDLIIPGVNGFRAKNKEDFKVKINTALFQQKWDKTKIIKFVSENYSLSKIIKEYEDYFKSYTLYNKNNSL